MSDLRQASNGKWKIVGIKHDQPGISVPAEYTYKGSKKTFNITTSEKTIVTDWETPLGEAIKLADITRTYTDVVDGNKIYRVKLPENFTIHPAGTPEPDPTITLKLSPTTTISSDGGTIRYTATTTPTDTEIEVKCSNNLSITKTTKTGSFSVPANSSESQITYYVSAYCADNPRIIAAGSVKQAAYVPPVEDEFEVSQIQSPFDFDGGTRDDAFFITNPQGHAWTSTAPDWVQLTPDDGNSTTGIYLEVSKRTGEDTSERTGDIIITDTVTSKPYTVTVIQNGFVPELTLTAVVDPILATATSLTYNVKCNTNVIVKYGTEQKTHSATQEQGATDGFTIEPNETTSPISHVITAFCTNFPNVSTSVTITQQGKEEDLFNVTQVEYVFPYTGETKNGFFTITNPQGHSWTATCPDTWVIIGKRSGSDGGSINVTVTGRDDTLVRTRFSDITVKDLTTNKTYTVSVQQAGYTEPLLTPEVKDVGIYFESNNPPSPTTHQFYLVNRKNFNFYCGGIQLSNGTYLSLIDGDWDANSTTPEDPTNATPPFTITYVAGAIEGTVSNPPQTLLLSSENGQITLTRQSGGEYVSTSGSITVNSNETVIYLE